MHSLSLDLLLRLSLRLLLLSPAEMDGAFLVPDEVHPGLCDNNTRRTLLRVDLSGQTSYVNPVSTGGQTQGKWGYQQQPWQPPHYTNPQATSLIQSGHDTNSATSTQSRNNISGQISSLNSVFPGGQTQGPRAHQQSSSPPCHTHPRGNGDMNEVGSEQNSQVGRYACELVECVGNGIHFGQKKELT